jgi:5-formyltetrahydrofolate cyclo-ligase
VAALAARRSLDKETAHQFSAKISRKVMRTPEFERARTIFSYQPFDDEADVSLMNERALRAGKRLAFPICIEDGVMIAAIPHTSEDWDIGRYGIKSPIKERSFILDPADIDLVIVPCVAFEGRRRLRVGWGAGYYDRYLPLCENAVSIAIAYECQQIENLCHDEWDVPPDQIITESNRYR